MEHTEIGFGKFIDKTLKKITSSYLRVFKEHDINISLEQWVILSSIHDLGDKASQVEISKSNYRNRATTSRLISGLVDKGLVQKIRFKGDQKRYKLAITPAGHSLVTKVTPLITELRKTGYKNISNEEVNTFMKVLEQIWLNFDNSQKSNTRIK